MTPTSRDSCGWIPYHLAARVALAPLDPDTREPIIGRAVILPRNRLTPAEVKLPPGDYFVEVLWPENGHFHQVFRHVPRAGDAPGAYSFFHWVEKNGVIELARVRDRQPAEETIAAEMTRFEGSDSFVMPQGPVTKVVSSARPVRAFYLDNHEVTVGEYARPVGPDSPPKGLPESYHSLQPDPREAIRFLAPERAVHDAEGLGKRLPFEAEYKFAATDGGRSLFPWGNTVSDDTPSWEIGPVGTDLKDHARHYPQVVGLASNVAEWSMSRVSTFLPTNPPPGQGRMEIRWNLTWSPLGDHLRRYLVQGVPPSLAPTRPAAGALSFRFDSPSLPHYYSEAHVGFRCVRSVGHWLLNSRDGRHH